METFGIMHFWSWLGRSPGERDGNPLQYSCLEIPWTQEPGGLQSMGLQKSGVQLSDKTTTFGVNAQYTKKVNAHPFEVIPR